MDETWTLSELVAEAKARLDALPPPKNGQVRAVPDERTIRYYSTIGLLDRPAAMRGRTALYGRKHLAQVVAIKRMQSAGRSLAEIQALWATLDDVTLSRMSGVQVATGARQGATPKAARKEFWKREVEEAPPSPVIPSPPRATMVTSSPSSPVALPVPTFTPYAPAVPSVTSIHLSIASNVAVLVGLPEDAPVSLSPADVRALRAAAAPLVAELAKRGLIAPDVGTLEEP